MFVAVFFIVAVVLFGVVSVASGAVFGGAAFGREAFACVCVERRCVIAETAARCSSNGVRCTIRSRNRSLRDSPSALKKKIAF